MKNATRPQTTQPAMSGWTRFVLALLVIASPTLVLAHNSTEDLETQINTREHYAELTDRVAPGFILQDADANTIRLDDFRGKVVILNFLYSRCEEQCPLHSVKLAEVQQQLSLASLSDMVQFITIATDTEDAASTTESMRAHGPRYGLNPANWVFLHGGARLEDLGLQLAAAYGLKFVPTDDGEQMHAVVTHLIDTQGRLRARYHGLNFNPANLTIHAAALVHDDHNKGDGKSVDSTPATAKANSIMLFAAFVSLVGLVCIAIFYYWKRRRYGAGHSQTQVSPTRERIE